MLNYCLATILGAKKRPGLRGMENVMSAEKYNLMGMPVVQTLQMIIDGLIVGDEAAGILRDAIASQKFAEDLLDARRTLIACAKERLSYVTGDRAASGGITVGSLESISSSLLQ
jgi:hypothetical protein